MSSPLQTPKANSHLQNLAVNLQQRFFKRDGTWYINIDEQNIAGPYPDKADAQMALMYFSARTLWPTDKQLREFARIGH